MTDLTTSDLRLLLDALATEREQANDNLAACEKYERAASRHRTGWYRGNNASGWSEDKATYRDRRDHCDALMARLEDEVMDRADEAEAA